MRLNLALTPPNHEKKKVSLWLSQLEMLRTQESDWAISWTMKTFFDLKYFICISWNIQMSENTQRINSILHTHPDFSYFGDLT